MEITKVPVSFESDIYDESRFSYADKLVYTVVAEEINQYGEIDHVGIPGRARRVLRILIGFADQDGSVG